MLNQLQNPNAFKRFTLRGAISIQDHPPPSPSSDHELWYSAFAFSTTWCASDGFVMYAQLKLSKVHPKLLKKLQNIDPSPSSSKRALLRSPIPDGREWWVSKRLVLCFVSCRSDLGTCRCRSPNTKLACSNPHCSVSMFLRRSNSSWRSCELLQSLWTR